LDVARDRFGSLDIVVANAGLDEGLGPVMAVTEAEYDRMFSVNAKGAFFTLQMAGRMVDSGGSIIYIGSSSTLRPQVGFGLYSSSKLPGNFLVKVLAQEVGERGITVNAVIPTATDGAGFFTENTADNPLRSRVQNASPLGKRMAVCRPRGPGCGAAVCQCAAPGPRPARGWAAAGPVRVGVRARARSRPRRMHLPGPCDLRDRRHDPVRRR
jgi:NAD(P)-dependent dehydrogenase (short-subunit alcohol dehydrogenase family)